MEYIYLGLAVLAAICWLIGYRLHLNFGRDVLEKTDSSASLKDAAEFTRSYRSANFKSFTDAIAKLLGRGRRPLELGQAVQHGRSALLGAFVGIEGTTVVRRQAQLQLPGSIPLGTGIPLATYRT